MIENGYKEKRDKWVILCGTGMVTDYLTDSEIIEATEEEIFDKTPSGLKGGWTEEICGGIKSSFPIKLTPNTKNILANLTKELEKIK